MKRFTTLCALLITCFAVSPLIAQDALNLNFRFENVPEDKQFVADLIKTRIAERSPSGALTVAFKLDADAFEPEEFAVESNGSEATISSGEFLGLVFGAGKLLRSIDYRADGFDVPTFSIREKPNAPFRCCYYARHFHNWYHMADAAELERYTEDLALWGFNVVSTLPVPTINVKLDPESDEWRSEVEGVKKIRNAVHRLGMKLVLGNCTNQATVDMPKEIAATPNVDPKRGNNGQNACPSNPEGFKFLERLYRAIYESYSDGQADYASFWPFDEGGCECEKCAPWAKNGFLKYSALFGDLIKKEYAPDQVFILSTWTYHEDEFQAAWEWLKEHPEFEYVLADSHGDFPKYPLENPLPEGRKLITFPEISMWGRGPWGGYGATPLPGRFTALWNQVRGHVDGCMQYSEGPFEDINKIVVGRFYYDDADADETLREYARYELCGADPEDFVKLCRAFERVHLIQDSPSPEYRETSIEAMKIAMKIDSEILPSLKNCLRWRQCYCRALTDYERNVRGTINTQTYADAIRELQILYHSDRFPEGCDDPMHWCTAPSMPGGEIKAYPRPEEELNQEK